MTAPAAAVTRVRRGRRKPVAEAQRPPTLLFGCVVCGSLGHHAEACGLAERDEMAWSDGRRRGRG